jgi:hypothetical protein
MFWNKKEPDEPEIVCKGCGVGITEGNAVLDANTGSFVCKDCQRVGYETNKLTNSNEVKEKISNDSNNNNNPQKIIKTESVASEEKLSFSCKSCGFIINYSKEKGKPGSCGYCGERV